MSFLQVSPAKKDTSFYIQAAAGAHAALAQHGKQRGFKCDVARSQCTSPQCTRHIVGQQKNYHGMTLGSKTAVLGQSKHLVDSQIENAYTVDPTSKYAIQDT